MTAFRTSVLVAILPGLLTAGTSGNTEREPGLQKAVFETPDGSVTVHFPDDVRAGDTLSGVVVAEPEGDSEKKRRKSQDRLDGLVVDVEGQKSSVNEGLAKWSIPAGTSVIVRLLDRKGKELARTSLPVQPTPLHEFASLPAIQEDVTGVVLNLREVPPKVKAPASPGDFRLPTVGQTGRTATSTGPFDGDLGTTAITVDGKEVKLLAESPRQLVFESPQGVTGKTVLHLKERDVEIEGAYRSLGVRLYAPTTELTRGQTTTLSAAVDGLTGLTEEIPLDLKTSGVVSMAGGDEQRITIRPADVGPGGSCSFERTITGIQTGSFNVVATVKVPETTIRISEPTNGATVGEPRPKFTWTVEHAPAHMTYAVKLVEGVPGSPLQEATLGFPHWVGKDIPSTEWTYPREAPPLRPGATYAVVVKGVLDGAVAAVSGSAGFLFRPDPPANPQASPPPAPATKGAGAICGPDVTGALATTLFGLETAFERLDTSEKVNLCSSLVLPTGTNAWDVDELRNRGWLARYTPPCCVPKKPCDSTVTVDGRCFYAGSVNYVIFGAMARLCWGNNSDTEDLIRSLVWAYKGPGPTLETLRHLEKGDGAFDGNTWAGAKNWAPSRDWALAGLKGWPRPGAQTPAEERACSPTCPLTYPNDHFRVKWDTRTNILEEAGMYGYCPSKRCSQREKVGEEDVRQDNDWLWMPCPVPGCPGARAYWTKGAQRKVTYRQKVDRCTLPNGHLGAHRLAKEYAFFSEIWRTERFEKYGETLSDCAHTWPEAAFEGERDRLVSIEGKACVDVP